ncbi:MAG: MobC family plasmid mobilization relaxosome protein [Acidobacteria bacterium]|nr:MobC family plasmid mobilization relaxosome protein [Acidobacteriota bacterium]
MAPSARKGRRSQRIPHRARPAFPLPPLVAFPVRVSMATENCALARVGVNLNQIARWANRYRGAADAAQVIAHLVALDREVRQLALRRDPDLPPSDEEPPC